MKILILKTMILDKEGLPWIKKQLELLSQKRIEVGKSSVEIKESTLEALNYNLLRMFDYVLVAGIQTLPAKRIIQAMALIHGDNTKGYLTDIQEKFINERLIFFNRTSTPEKDPYSGREDRTIDGNLHLFYSYAGHGKLLIDVLLPYEKEVKHTPQSLLSAVWFRS